MPHQTYILDKRKYNNQINYKLDKFNTDQLSSPFTHKLFHKKQIANRRDETNNSINDKYYATTKLNPIQT